MESHQVYQHHTSENLLTKGLLLIERGLYKHAIEYFTGLLANDPNNFSIYYYISLCHYHNGKPKEGLAAAFKAIELNPEYYHAYDIIAWTYFTHKKDFQNAEKFALEALNLNPNSADIYALLSHIYLFDNKYNLSFECATESLKQDPENYIAHLTLGIYHYSFNNFDKSQQHLLKCLQLAPNSSAGYLNYGLLSIEFAKTKQGYELLREAIKLNPEEKFYQKCFKKAFIVNHILYKPIIITKLDYYFPYYLSIILFGFIFSGMISFIEFIRQTNTFFGSLIAIILFLALNITILLVIYKFIISIILNIIYSYAIKNSTLHKII